MNRRQLILAMNGLAIATHARQVAAAPVPRRVQTLDRQDLEDILAGSTYFGCGGGGTLADARRVIDADLDAGLTFNMLGVGEMGDDEYAAVAYGVGSLAPVSAAEIERRRGLARIEGSPAVAAFRLLEQHLDRTLAAVIVGELAPASVSGSLSTAAHLAIPVLDADAAGRAVPEVSQYSLLVAGIPVLPAAAVSPYGDEVLLTKVVEASREEEILRVISSVCENNLGVADGAIPGKVARQPGALVTGSVSRARKVGRAVREANEGRLDPVRALLESGDGYLLFEGRITDFESGDMAGFLVGEVVISGSGRFQGNRYRIWFKNENIIGWMDDEFSVTAPDLFTLVSPSTGEAIMNHDLERGRQVAVVGFQADPLWRTPRGLEVFGPRHFGYDVPYVPIEKRYAARS